MQAHSSGQDSLSTVITDPSQPDTGTEGLQIGAASLKRLRVLIVDDHATARALLRILLEQHEDLEIVGEAVDGEEAVSLAEVYRPDVVLMDVHLPRMNGVEATRKITRLLPDAAIIGISTQYSPFAYNAMTAAGAAAFVRKEDAVEAVYKTIHFSLHARAGRIH